MTSGSDRGNSTQQEEKIEWTHCHKHHPSTCRRIIEGFFLCGSTYHLIVNCQRGSECSRNAQGSSRVRSNVSPPTRDRARGRGCLGKHRRSIASETVNHSTITSPVEAYAMRAREDQDTPGVIMGNFTLYDTEMYALVDPGSKHSYICIE